MESLQKQHLRDVRARMNTHTRARTHIHHLSYKVLWRKERKKIKHSSNDEHQMIYNDENMGIYIYTRK